MIINDCTDKVFNILKEGLEDIKIIKAYPMAYKPTRMTSPMVCVSPFSMEQRAVGFGEYASDVDIVICVDVFVAYKDGIDVLDGIVDSILQTDVVKDAKYIKLGAPSSDKMMDSICTQLLLGYNIFIGD